MGLVIREHGDVFSLKERLIFQIFNHCPRPLKAEEVYFYYLVLRVYQIEKPELKPINLKEHFETFKKALHLFQEAGYLLSKEGLYQLNPRKYKSLKTKKGLNRFLWQLNQLIKQERDLLTLAALIIVKKRFPFLKAHELQVALERVFSLKESYRQVERLLALAEKILALFKKETIKPVRLLFYQQALARACY